MYERALTQQRLDARRQRYRERQRVLLVVFCVTAVVFFALFVR
jgi:type VI protein secretion system component VasF